jgi:hypothetical protein
MPQKGHFFMKTTHFVFSILGLLMTSNAFATSITLKCVNEAHSSVTTSINMNSQAMNLTFGSGADKSSMEQDIKNKSLTMKLDLDGSSETWVQYSGQVLTNSYFDEYRTIQARMERSSISQSSFRVAMAISTTHSEYQSADTFTSYGMICSRSF